MPHRDEVDRLVAAWQEQRPDLDVSPLEVFSRVSRLAKHLERHRRAAFAASDLSVPEFDVLAALRRMGAPYQLSPKSLLRRTLVSSGTMTNRIDRLHARGLVERHSDPSDRRGVLVRLTPLGLERVDAAIGRFVEAERQLLAELSEDEQTQLATLLRTITVSFDNQLDDEVES